jgi:DNA repair photolyase
MLGEKMSIIVNEVDVKSYVSKSNLPSSDFVINPYLGCPHACKYCYACFMKRFSGHQEKWGEFVDVKICKNPIKINKLVGKTVLLSSVTDCYNYFEENYNVTRDILKQLVNVDFELNISTKSMLVCRDIDLLKKFSNLKVAISLNTTDENFKNDMDNASSILERMDALTQLHNAGIYTVVFMSPIFPEITNFKNIIESTRDYVDEYWFENLNLRGHYKETILSYIKTKHPDLLNLYNTIYNCNKKDYWVELGDEIKGYCEINDIKYLKYFYHEELVKNRVKKNNS